MINYSHILLVGATSDIMFFTAIELLKKYKPRNMTLTGRNDGVLKKLKENIQGISPDVKINLIILDLSLDESVEKLKTIIDNQSIDGLIYGAGTMNEGNSYKELVASYKINTIIPSFLLQYAAEAMESISPYGFVAAISSVSAARGKARTLHYSSAKNALLTFFEGLSQKTNIQATVFVPGFVDTKMLQEKKNREIPPTLLITPKEAASVFVNGIKHKKKRIFSQRKWMLMFYIFKVMPEFVWRKISND